MNFKIRRTHEWGGILFLWAYDLVKYGVFGELALSCGIDPAVFLFWDMVTVPPFIMGSARLVNSLAGNEALAWPRVLGWGLLVLASTVIPYVYAAMAGHAQFDTLAWMIFWGLIFLILGNLFRSIRGQVVKEKNNR